MIVCFLSSFAVLMYGIALAKFIPNSWHAVTNSLAVVAAVYVAVVPLDITFSSLGISIDSLIKGAVIGLAASFLIIALAFVLASLPIFHGYFLSQHSILKTKTSRIVYETVVRIPIITALFEEIIFRGFLLAVFLIYLPTIWAVALSSIVFGLWHVFPAINTMNENHYKKFKANKSGGKLYIAGNVLATAGAGVVFSILRLMSGSIIAPWLVHWAINAGGVVSVLFAKSRSEKNLH